MTALAVVGTGSIGTKHLHAARLLGGIRPIAVPRRPQRALELAALHFETAPDLKTAAEMGATLCIVATDTGRHAEDARSALENGMHVLIEKPLTPGASQAKRLCWEARRSRRKVFVGCVLRFAQSLNAFRSALPKIGELHHVRIECQGYLPNWRRERPYQESYSARAKEGGVLRDLIHEIDYAGWLFGWPKTVKGNVSNLGRLGIQAEESADILWTTPYGASLSIHVDYLTRIPRRKMRASGSKGCVEWDGHLNSVSVERLGAPRQLTSYPQSREEMLQEQVRTFLAECKRKAVARYARIATGDDGIRALAVCDATWRSSRTGREEKVSL